MGKKGIYSKKLNQRFKSYASFVLAGNTTVITVILLILVVGVIIVMLEMLLHMNL